MSFSFDNDQKTRFQRLIDQVNEHLVLVEGKTDEEALRKLGVRDVVALSGKSLDKIMEIRTDRPVLVLSDFDSEGKRISGKISDALQRNGTRVNVPLRRKIFEETRVAHISDLKK